MLSNFLRYDKDDIIYTGEKLEILIPTDWIDNGLATIIGNSIKVLGLLNCRGYDSKDKVLFNEMINLPSTIVIYPDNMEERTEDIGNDQGPTKYNICTFYKNSKVMSKFITQDSDNVQSFLDMMMRAKIVGVPYNTLLDIWLKNLEINKVNLGVPNAILELIISEIYRDADDLSHNYAYAKNKNPKIRETYYIPANERQLCAKNSTFAALSFEDVDSMITYSLNMNTQQKKQKISPIEKVIKY